MKFNPKRYKEERWRFLLIIAMFWFFAFILIKDAFKTRADFKVINGVVTEEGDTKIEFKTNNFQDVYYFRLSTYGQYFGIGTDENLKPILDKNFNRLSIGDSIQVTFDENEERINQEVNEIVRDGEVIYDIMPRSSWNGRMRVGLGCFAIGLGFLTVMVLLNRKYNRMTKKING